MRTPLLLLAAIASVGVGSSTSSTSIAAGRPTSRRFDRLPTEQELDAALQRPRGGP